MKKTIFEDYEQMNIGSNDYTHSKGYTKNKCLTKKRLFLFIFLISIIILIIYLIVKPSKKSSSSDSNNNTNDNSNKDTNNNNSNNDNNPENQLALLTKKEEELKNENNKLISQKDTLQKENDNISQQIKDLTEENKKKKDNKKDIEKEISEKKGKIKDYEKKLKDSKNTLDELTKKQKDLNKKLNENNSQVKSLEQKIEELEKELKQEESTEKKEEEKKEEEKKEEEKKEEEKKEDNDKKDDESKEPDPNVKSRIDSKIIIDPKYLDILDKWFKTELKYKLLYRATDEQYSAATFHSKVNEFKNTIIFIKDINNFIYGGFTRKTWDGNKIYKADKNAIVFNLDKELYYTVNDPNHAIFCDPDYLAVFGEGDIYLGPKSIESSFPKTYGSTSNNKKNELTMGFDKLSPLEMEAFQLS